MLINLCSLSKVREDYHLQYVRNIQKKQKEGAKLIVAGCIAKISSEAVAALNPYAAVAPTDRHQLDELLNADTKIKEFGDHG